MRPRRTDPRALSGRQSCGKAKALILTLLAALAAGCGFIEAPTYHYDAEGARVMYKRTPEYAYVGAVRRADRVAYESGAGFKAEQLTPDQQEAYDYYGAPEYIRRPFTSTRGEIVGEWLYPRDNVLLQWIDGKKAFQGEVTDQERVLLDHGYPDVYAWIDADPSGPQRQTWIYGDELNGTRQVYNFSNGKMVQGHSPNL